MGYEKLREIKNVFHGKEITVMAVSVYHNLIVTGTNFPTIIFWNFEFGKIMALLSLEPDEDPTALEFINGYSILIIGTSQGFIYFVHFVMQDDNLELNLIGNISLLKSLVLR